MTCRNGEYENFNKYKQNFISLKYSQNIEVLNLALHRMFNLGKIHTLCAPNHTQRYEEKMK